MDIENLANPDINRKLSVADWKKLSSVDVSVSESIEKLAESFALIGVKPMDALHVACAIEAKAEYFLTTDKALLRKMTQDNRTQVVDPVDFIRLLSET
jgi:predicted nucleic acid-binding protein